MQLCQKFIGISVYFFGALDATLGGMTGNNFVVVASFLLCSPFLTINLFTSPFLLTAAASSSFF